MKKRNHSRATISTYEAVKKIRGDWGAVNPVTRRIENKKRNFIPNYEEFDEWYSMDDCCHDLESRSEDDSYYNFDYEYKG